MMDWPPAQTLARRGLVAYALGLVPSYLLLIAFQDLEPCRHAVERIGCVQVIGFYPVLLILANGVPVVSLGIMVLFPNHTDGLLWYAAAPLGLLLIFALAVLGRSSGSGLLPFALGPVVLVALALAILHRFHVEALAASDMLQRRAEEPAP